MTDIVRVERHDHVALIVMNRPQARNAMNVELASATCDAINACQDARAIVLTGADPAFCAGLDLRSLGVTDLVALPPFNATAAASKVPMIAAVNGPAVTGGFELALACDFIIASERAAFADTHVRVGVYPGPVLVDLPRRVGMAWARQMSMTGDFVDAATALRIGLVNELVPHEALLPRALQLASSIADQDPKMIAAMREDWDQSMGLPIAQAHEVHWNNSIAGGFRDAASSDTLEANRAAVMERSKQQRGH
ncbi:MAG: enoyl-CoA hydratase [Acidimicrobiia bacterium]